MSDELENCSLLLSTQLFAAKEILDKLILAQTAHTKQIQDQQKALSKIPGQIIAEQKTLFDFQQQTNQVESRIEGLSAEKAQLEKDVSYLQIKIDSKNTELEAAKSELNEVKQATKDAKIVAGEVDLILKKMTKDITAAKNEVEVQVKPSSKRDLEEEEKSTKESKRSKKTPVVSLLHIEISGELEAKMLKDTARVYLQEKAKHEEVSLDNVRTSMVSLNHVRSSMLKDGIITKENVDIWNPLISTCCDTFSVSQAKNAAGLVRYLENKKKNMQRSPYKKLASGVKKLVQNMDSKTLETLKNDEEKYNSSQFSKVIKQANEKTKLVVDIPEDILSWMFQNSFVVSKKEKLCTSKVNAGSASSNGNKKELCQDPETESDDAPLIASTNALSGRV